MRNEKNKRKEKKTQQTRKETKKRTKLSPLERQKLRQVNKQINKEKNIKKEKETKKRHKRWTTHTHKRNINPITPTVKVSFGVFTKHFIFASISKAFRKNVTLLIKLV